MFKYLWAAFKARAQMPLVGSVPVNLIAVTAFTILGFGNPAFWLAGLGLETAYLFLMGTSQRFQKYVDAMEFARGREKSELREADLNQLTMELGPTDRKRLTKLMGQFDKVRTLYRKLNVEEFTAAQNLKALDTLLRTHARLLMAAQNILSMWSGDPKSINAEIAELELELQREDLSHELRNTRMRTLEIMRARLDNQRRKDTVLEEMAGELERIEAQFDLALENAAISSKPYTISDDVVFDLDKLDTNLYTPPLAEPEAPAPGKQRSGRRVSE